MKLLLVIVSIIGLSAVIGAVVVGTKTFDGTVVEKPYEQGLAYDSAHHEREASGWSAVILNKSFSVGKNSVLIEVKDRNGKMPVDAEVALIVSRPSSSSHDREYKAVKTEKGLYSVDTELPLYGYWQTRIQVADRQKKVTFERTIFAERKKQ